MSLETLPGKTLAEPPRRNRSGYYTLPDGSRCLSVTTILENGVPKPALIPWTAREVARCAIDNIPGLARLRGREAREEMFVYLRDAAIRQRDDAADRGAAVHTAVEALVLDQPWPEPTPEQQPYLDAFARFVADYRPEWEATEMVVAQPDHQWAGTADWWAYMTLPDHGRTLVIGDIKTGKGVWPEAALQLSAYRRGTVGWLRDGTEVTPPQAEYAVVLHLRPDKYPERGYALYEVDTGDEVYEAFRAAHQVALFSKTRAKKTIGKPLEYPATQPKEAA